MCPVQSDQQSPWLDMGSVRSVCRDSQSLCVAVCPDEPDLGHYPPFGFAESISGMILKNLPIVIAGFLTGVLGVIAAVKLSGDCSQMLLFVLAGVILALTGVCVKCLRK